jgi:hypothetical protein
LQSVFTLFFACKLKRIKILYINLDIITKNLTFALILKFCLNHTSSSKTTVTALEAYYLHHLPDFKRYVVIWIVNHGCSSVFYCAWIQNYYILCKEMKELWQFKIKICIQNCFWIFLWGRKHCCWELLTIDIWSSLIHGFCEWF